MLPRSLGSAARRLAAAPARGCASSASATRRLCPPSDGEEAAHDERVPPPHAPETEQRRLPRRGEHRTGSCIPATVPPPQPLQQLGNPTARILPPHTQSNGEDTTRDRRPRGRSRGTIEVSAPKRVSVTVFNSSSPRKEDKKPHRPVLDSSATSPSAPPPPCPSKPSPAPPKSPGHCRAELPFLKCKRTHRRDSQHHPQMANGLLLRGASPCPRPAAATGGGSADPGRRHAAVTIGDFRTRGVALRVAGSSRRGLSFVTTASRDHSGLTRQLLDFQHDTVDEVGTEHDPFTELKARFMDFKQRNYVEKFSKYQSLAELQTPKFMVVACADSRVCPTGILGFQPGDAFTVRNVANLVPPYEHEGSETSAALEFAVNTLQVENILVVGHSRCGGIQALMSMKDDSTSGSFIKNWVSIGKSARLSTKAAAGNLSFEMQCKHCEKESINSSLLNLLTYPWIEKRVNEGTLNLHGGYYNFIDCTFEKWTLVYREGLEGGSKYAIKNRSTWS